MVPPYQNELIQKYDRSKQTHILSEDKEPGSKLD